ncbi:MAG TPA: DUF2239 family protein [Sphingobium sp.]|uniref:DUF2239 family protein n=1 Tax=Sphingobium sp. TaxID=1912891 RepID=UPI002ED6371B
MTDTITAFLGDHRMASGTREEVTRAILADHPQDQDAVRAHDDSSGKVVDLDYRGVGPVPAPRGRGRPSLGVTAREVTLLPRHWDWLATQRGGASAALRRLIDAARAEPRTLRQRQDAAYAFMADSCGDRPGYEEALRSLYRGEDGDFAAQIADWPEDIRTYISRLLADD